MIGPVTFSFEELVAHKEAGVSEAALAKLRAEADKILASEVVDVTMRTLRAPSGDPRDYISIAPYRWPNPDTPDGLPWVGRDGHVNPDTVQKIGIGIVYSRVFNLALAAFYFGDNGYLEYAERQLRAWYINPETRMTPNARYGQCIPGVCDGRSTGLLDFATVYILFNGIGIFESMGLLSEETLRGVREWYNEFLNWMLTSEQALPGYGCDENAGCWFDAHTLAIALGTGRKRLATNIAKTAYAHRVKRQIRPDGSQPGELRRTKALSYSFYNYRALMVVARIAERLGMNEYWTVDKERGVCIMKQAIDYLYPFVKNPETFPYQELYIDKQATSIIEPLLAINKRFPNQGYDKRAAEFGNRDGEITALYPQF